MKTLLGIVVLSLLSFKAIAAPTFVDSYSVESQEEEPRGLTFNNDGTKMYVTGWDGDDINTYNLSTAWDVSTASFASSKSVSAQTNDPRDINFNTDGTKMFLLDKQNDEVHEYTLSTAFDVSTISIVDNFDISSEENLSNGLEFSTDGTKMYMVGSTGDDINEYTLSTAFDISTASFVHSFNFVATSSEERAMDMTFNHDGTKMYITGWDENGLHEYKLSTAWNVSTASFVDTFDITAQDEGPSALVFSPDGSKLFVLGATDLVVDEFKLTCSYGIMTCQDPTSDKDDVASVESQTESAKQLIQHTTYPVLNRMEWLRRNNNNSNLTNQNIKFQFSNEILASLSNLIIPTYLNNEETTSELKSSNWSFWSEGTVSIGKIGDSLSSSAKNINTTAITIGADKKTDNDRMFGLALRFGNDDIDFGDVKNSLGMDAVSLTLYETRPHGEGKFISNF